MNSSTGINGGYLLKDPLEKVFVFIVFDEAWLVMKLNTR